MSSFIPTASNPVPHTSAAYNMQRSEPEVQNKQLAFLSGILSDLLTDHHIAQRRRVRPTPIVEIVKLRAIETSHEILFLTSKKQPNVLLIRFLKHVDRFYSTASLRMVMRQVSIDMAATSTNDITAFIQGDAFEWLKPNHENVRHPGTLFLAVENQDKPTSALTASTFKVAHARVLTVNNEPFMEVANADKSIVKLVSTRLIEKHIALPDMLGRHYVEFFNGDYVILTSFIFNQQFVYVHAAASQHSNAIH